jgi:hemin uptake protein HemP
MATSHADGWLADGSNPRLAGINPSPLTNCLLTAIRTCRIVRFNLTAAIISLPQTLSSIFSGLGSKRKMEERQTAGEEAAAPPRRSSGPRSASSDATQAAEPLEIESEALLGGRSEIRIRHRGEVYRLTLTRAGKLILHK